MNKVFLIIKNFALSWFASVMGTGIVAIASFYYSHYWPWLQNLATAPLVLALLPFTTWVLPAYLF
ncbi:MAG: hypothetical protein WCY82_07340 [Desulfotomaculaceae bacterium]